LNLPKGHLFLSFIAHEILLFVPVERVDVLAKYLHLFKIKNLLRIRIRYPYFIRLKISLICHDKISLIHSPIKELEILLELKRAYA